MGVGIKRQRDPPHLAAVVRRAVHQIKGDDAILQNLRLVVDVVQEEVERFHPLNQARLEHVPLERADDARHRVKRYGALGALFVAVHRKGNALVAKGEFGKRHPAGKLLGAYLGKPLEHRLVRVSRHA